MSNLKNAEEKIYTESELKEAMNASVGFVFSLVNEDKIIDDKKILSKFQKFISAFISLDAASELVDMGNNQEQKAAALSIVFRISKRL